MDESRPLHTPNGMIGKKVIVTLKNGVIYEGSLKAFDIHTNIVLEDCTSQEKKLGTVFIAGYNLECCWLDQNNK